MTNSGAQANRQTDLWPQLERLEDCRNPTLRWILNGFDEYFEKKVHLLRTTWNTKIRNYYRDVLSLNTRRHPIHATYKLDDNGRFIRLIEEHFPDLDFAKIVALKRYVAEAKQVVEYYDDWVAKEALLSSIGYARSELDKYKLEDIVKFLFNFYQRSPESDVFGCYYIKQHTIDIYLIPCIIFSMLIEEDFLDVAIGTLAHELAHGFHHVGADKDGATWEHFRDVEPTLVEGLAEYYTRQFSISVTAARPSVLMSFDKTSEHLPKIYRQYESWGDDFGLEVIYQAFIETRRSGIMEFDVFERLLADSRKRLARENI